MCYQIRTLYICGHPYDSSTVSCGLLSHPPPIFTSFAFTHCPSCNIRNQLSTGRLSGDVEITEHATLFIPLFAPAMVSPISVDSDAPPGYSPPSPPFQYPALMLLFSPLPVINRPYTVFEDPMGPALLQAGYVPFVATPPSGPTFYPDPTQPQTSPSTPVPEPQSSQHSQSITVPSSNDDAPSVPAGTTVEVRDGVTHYTSTREAGDGSYDGIEQRGWNQEQGFDNGSLPPGWGSESCVAATSSPEQIVDEVEILAETSAASEISDTRDVVESRVDERGTEDPILQAQRAQNANPVPRHHTDNPEASSSSSNAERFEPSPFQFPTTNWPSELTLVNESILVNSAVSDLSSTIAMQGSMPGSELGITSAGGEVSEESSLDSAEEMQTSTLVTSGEPGAVTATPIDAELETVQANIPAAGTGENAGAAV